MKTFTYLVVEPGNSGLSADLAPNAHEVGELVPRDRPDLKNAVPVLYRLDHPDLQLPAIKAQEVRHREEGGKPHVCGVLETQAGERAIWQHLSNSLILQHPEAGSTVFRYYDPRVFAHLPRILNSHQLHALAGPITEWAYLDAEGEWRRVTTEGQGALAARGDDRPVFPARPPCFCLPST
jgi:hypothetical protein